MKRISTISLVVAAAFCSVTVQAEVVSSAWLGPISIQLIDLDLNDGITPSITPVQDKHSKDVYALGSGYAYDSSTNNYLAYGFDNASNSLPLSNNSNTGISQAESSIIGNDPSNANLYANGSASAASTGYFGNYFARSFAEGYFYLSANTQVTFTAEATSSASSNAPYSTGTESAQAVAFLTTYRTGWFVDVISDSLHSGAYNYDGGIYGESKSDTLSVSLTNPYTEAILAYFRGETDVYGQSNSAYHAPSEVPVPAALPLMASALGALGYCKRRKVV